MSKKADITIGLEIPLGSPDVNRWDVVYAVRDAVDAESVELEEALHVQGRRLNISRIGYHKADKPEEAAGA